MDTVQWPTRAINTHTLSLSLCLSFSHTHVWQCVRSSRCCCCFRSVDFNVTLEPRAAASYGLFAVNFRIIIPKTKPNRTEVEYKDCGQENNYGHTGNRTEKVYQEGEVYGGGRCPESDSERGEWNRSLREPLPSLSPFMWRVRFFVHLTLKFPGLGVC